jgi:DNA-binding NarL/FixJ family response regulator
MAVGDSSPVEDLREDRTSSNAAHKANRMQNMRYGMIPESLREDGESSRSMSLVDGGARRSPREVPRPISVMIVDGQRLVRNGVARLLEEDDRLTVVGDSDGGCEVPATCAAESIDVLVTDLQLPDVDGLEMIRAVLADSPGTSILVLTAAADWRVVPAMASGASGFLLKDADPEAVRAAIISVHRGERVLCREAARWLAGEHAAGTRLTKREQVVLHMVAEGAANREIAGLLGISEKTVRNYVSHLYHKLSLKNRAQIATYAMQVHPSTRERTLESTKLYSGTAKNLYEDR